MEQGVQTETNKSEEAINNLVFPTVCAEDQIQAAFHTYMALFRGVFLNVRVGDRDGTIAAVAKAFMARRGLGVVSCAVALYVRELSQHVEMEELDPFYKDMQTKLYESTMEINDWCMCKVVMNGDDYTILVEAEHLSRAMENGTA